MHMQLNSITNSASGLKLNILLNLRPEMQYIQLYTTCSARKNTKCNAIQYKTITTRVVGTQNLTQDFDYKWGDPTSSKSSIGLLMAF